MSEKSHLNLTWIRVRVYRMFLLCSFLLYGDWRTPAFHCSFICIHYEQAEICASDISVCLDVELIRFIYRVNRLTVSSNQLELHHLFILTFKIIINLCKLVCFSSFIGALYILHDKIHISYCL